MFEPEDSWTSEEIQHLNEAMAECQKIQEDVNSTLNYLYEISMKICAKEIDLGYFTPGNIWTTKPKPEHSTCSDVLINEGCQKHDFDSPQQHHKVQEINDASDFTGTSTEPNKVINHQIKVDESSYDARLTHLESSWEKSRTSVEFLSRHKFKVKVFQIKQEIKNSIRRLQRFMEDDEDRLKKRDRVSLTEPLNRPVKDQSYQEDQ